MKILITTISLLTTLSLSSIAGEYRYKAVQTGSGYTKGDATRAHGVSEPRQKLLSGVKACL
jgi:hypothetical protein